ncbi:MAG: hypothetical protein A2428_14670 [Bdellovibrionales bacterium RIFOXYC1_FULL_54_43]|nr:MAG: hypothetical protein A2428_14670 [Bdellovibrionales bacterium RIFOXYC1_FULL_54_43]OFZ82521.1 MAG: hypothetical protein A2603_15485 [Bdellovibrionales bacterium RIFOXYD1_FULL_55_31]
MEPAFVIYTFAWAIGTASAVAFLIHTRSTQILFHRSYYGFLFRPWKVVTFLISGAGVTLLGPYTTDPTWDWVDGSFMSILAYFTGPWAVGTIYRALAGLDTKKNLYPALFVWMFSASWSYDIYLYFRDGFYPPTWWSNLILSSILYFSAGMFWSLDWKSEKGVIFSFRENQWPYVSNQRFLMKIIWIGLPFMAVAAWLTLGFLKIFNR